jgi:hypothetical protein
MATAVPIAISLLALAVSIANAWVSYARHRRDLRSIQPVASAEISPIADNPGWFRTFITVKNYAQHGYAVQRIELRAPKCAGFLPGDIADKFPSWNQPEQWEDHLPNANVQKRVDSPMRVQPPGSQDHMTRSGGILPGDQDVDSIPLFCPPSVLPAKITIFVTLRSVEAREREIVLKLKRTLPAVTRCASD